MNPARIRWVALATIPLVTGLLVLVGLPKVSDLNPFVALERAKLAIKHRDNREPLQMSQLIIDPRNHDVIYGSTHFYGMIKSVDRGLTWRFIAKGLGTSDVYSMALHPTKAGVIYAATTGAGVYRSDDGGTTWAQRNAGLTDTHVEDLAFDPAEPDTLYAATMREIFVSRDAGLTWAPAFVEDRRVAQTYYMHTLSVGRFPGVSQPVIFVGTPDGGFRRTADGANWERLDDKVQGQKLTVFLNDARERVLYAGSLGGKVYASRDAGRTWEFRGALPNNASWLHRLVLHPADPRIIYAGSKAHGVYHSADGGRSWTAMNTGLDYKVVKALAMDPDDPQRLYAGTPGLLAMSTDGAATWRTVPLALPRYDDVVTWLGSTSQSTDRTPPPPAIWKDKCNECHGWTDRRLNFYLRAYWRVAPSPRDWTDTMERMGALAKLTSEQHATILHYLNTHFGPSR